ncbi:MAG TPA: alpha-amylase family glycosyl hydrolase [Puia sp.]|nr:alpha-amylase family glycosyl hydrolase [Puia sp.]
MRYSVDQSAKHILIQLVLWLLPFFFSLNVKGQLLTVTPLFPVDTSSVTIIADCSKGNQGLYNYANNSDVYVHIGLITSQSASTSDWKYVKFTWGTTTPSAQAVSLGNNRYQYTINNIRGFFGVQAGETILKIAILFRNGNGSLVQRNSDGSDMFVSVYTNAVAAQFLLPPFQPTFNPIPEPINKNIGDTITVKYIANQNANLNIYFNDTLRQSASNADSITTNLVITAPGNQWIYATANNGVTQHTDTVHFYVSAPTNISPLPGGVADGINYLPGDTSVILVLFAPGKNKVMVVGDFNNWTQESSYQMNQTPDGKYFWIQINGLVPGTEYAYQFMIDDHLKVADYYTEKILDPDNDPAISPATYPNLKPYPNGKTTGIVSLLQTRAPAYNWNISQFSRPDKRSLHIYELLVRDFIATHNYDGLRDTLNYLKKLGINAVELMPVNEFEGNSSWGYNPSFYFAPDKYYGPKNSLKELIDACHSNGIAVIMDIVLDHSYEQSPMVQMYFNTATNEPASDNPWFNVTAPHQSIQFGYDFNHTTDATKYFVDRVLQFWLTEYKMDGFRFDFTKGFTQKQTTNDNDLSAYDTGRISILTRINNYVHSVVPDAYVILEHFAVNQEELVLASEGMMLWGNANYNFNQATMGYLDNDGSDFSQAIFTARSYQEPYLVSYMESHDEERLMYKNIKYGNRSGSYVIQGDTVNSLKRNEAAAAFYMTIPGPKMIWEFGELGYDYSRCYLSTNGENGDCNTKTDPKPIRWDYLQQSHRVHLHDIFSGMLQLRNNYPGLDTSSSIIYSLSGAFKSLQVNSPDLSITVIGNFDVSTASGNVVFQNAGNWYNYFTGDSITVTNAQQQFTLNAGEYRVYLNKKIFDSLNSPSDTAITPVNHLSLNIFPNPVISGSSSVRYQLPSEGRTTLSLFNMRGQKIYTVDNGIQSPGTYIMPMSQLPANISALSSGAYIMELRCNGQRIHFVFLVQR